MDGAQRSHARYRLTANDHAAAASRIRRRAVRLLRAVSWDVSRVFDRTAHAVSRMHAAAPRPVTRHVRRRSLTVRLASERSVPIGVALLVVLATAVSVVPSAVQPVGAAVGAGNAPRIAIGGGDGDSQLHASELARFFGTAPGVDSRSLTSDPDDGTVWKPVAVDTSVHDASGKLQHYTVQSGDSLSGIASKFGLSMMTVWWANNLTSKDALTIGQTLVIPPVDGLVRTVAAGDTLDAIAARYKITTDAIVKANELTDTNIIVGQTLLLPGAQGDPIPLPKIVAKQPSATSGGSGGPGRIYPSGGGSWAWPVVGHNYVSQYFSSRHPAIDIASTYGNPIISALPGTVVYAGWKDNGGGYQVWVSHGDGLYTGYYHMSAVTTSVGASVAQGEQVGRIGATGWATGPHCHFEVWVGYPWAHGSYRVNPLGYY
jgi:murein DD-endopeptidase MepM/ murein hydrolase activator NlpD